jgi:hypothetical protein
MQIPDRDRSVVQLVARFKQVSARQVSEALFSERSSRTPCDRALKRLVDQKFLARIERRIVGGSRGGSGVYVYGLGRRGFYTYFTGSYSPPRTVNYHALAIAEAYVSMLKASRAGAFEIVAVSTEPDCWAVVGGVELRPDMYVELQIPEGKLFCDVYEIDMGTESQRQLRGKLGAYYRAWDNADTPGFPRVVWVAVDEERRRELSWLVSQLHIDAQALFVVTTAERLPSLYV